jgi:hypothetical protein
MHKWVGVILLSNLILSNSGAEFARIGGYEDLMDSAKQSEIDRFNREGMNKPDDYLIALANTPIKKDDSSGYAAAPTVDSAVENAKTTLSAIECRQKVRQAWMRGDNSGLCLCTNNCPPKPAPVTTAATEASPKPQPVAETPASPEVSKPSEIGGSEVIVTPSAAAPSTPAEATPTVQTAQNNSSPAPVNGVNFDPSDLL